MVKLLKMLLVVTVLLTLLAMTAYADETASKTKRVVVKVLPNIGIGAGEPERAEIQTGKFWINVPFRVDANTQYIYLWIVATNLYKADDPASEVPPIVLCQDKKVQVIPTNGRQSDGDGNLAWDQAAMIGDFDGFQTVAGLFESSQHGHFSQDVDILVCWDQTDPEKPIGEYSGWVKMIAAVAPAGNP
jgi:hypothetical protein